MEQIVSTIVEDAPKGVVLIYNYDDDTRKDVNGRALQCSEVMIPYKKVNMFDTNGKMHVEYYTEDEWNDTEYYASHARMKSLHHIPCYLNGYRFFRVLNDSLKYFGLIEIAEMIKSGDFLSMDLLPTEHAEFIEYLLTWDCKTPLKYKGLIMHQTEEKDEETGETYYLVHSFHII